MSIISEEDITKYWDSRYNGQPLVTICCTTYNHEKFIKDAIESFLHQVTNFPFKIYIHDDCSSDKTKEIVTEYERKYPNIIQVICEDNNVYSKSKRLLREINNSHCSGKYEAFCEGDDYWIDPYKLQKEVEYLEKNENCSIVFTNGKMFDIQSNTYKPVFQDNEIETSESDRVITLDNFYMLMFPPTASYVIRKNCILDMDDKLSDCVAGDIMFRLYAMTKGYAYYLKDETCVYRVGVPGSETTKWKKYSKEEHRMAALSYLTLLDEIDDITNSVYHEGIDAMRSYYINIVLVNSGFLTLLKPKYYQFYKSFSLQRKIKIIARMLMPDSLYGLYKRYNS